MLGKSLVVFLFVGLIVSLCSATVFKVDANTEQCFHETLLKMTEVGLTFQVVEGGMLDIDVNVYSPEGDVIVGGDREKEGRYFFVTKSEGIYRFCFSNKMSTLTSKVISMTLNTGKNNEASEKSSNIDEVITPLRSSILRLADGLISISTEEQFMQLRERVHRNTAESTNARVMYWSLFILVLFVTMSLSQIVYIRRYFERKRRI